MIVVIKDLPGFEIPIVTLMGILKIRINPLKANQRQSLNGFKGIVMVNLTKSIFAILTHSISRKYQKCKPRHYEILKD
jgi:hypothetical protein